MAKQPHLIVGLILMFHGKAAAFDDGIVVTTLPTSILAGHHFSVIYGSPYDLPTDNATGIAYRGLKLPNLNTRLLSCDVDYRNDFLYIYDVNTAAIIRIEQFHGRNNFSSATLKRFHDGVSRSTVRLAIDWISHNVYWTDPSSQWIAVQSGGAAVEQRNFKTLITDDLNEPTALAVDPIHGLMFWSDIGDEVNGRYRIERATLTGLDRRTLISQGLLQPISIDVDISQSRIVWVDASRDTLESSDFDGLNRKVIRRLSSFDFIDLAIYRDIVTVTDYKTGKLIFFNKNNGELARPSFGLPSAKALSVAMYSADTQPVINNQCDTSSCRDICVSLPTGPQCLCKDGYQLQQDGITCSEREGMFARGVVMVTASSICLTDIRMLTTSIHWTNTLTCVFNATSLPDEGEAFITFDLDMIERNIVFATRTAIYSVDMATYSASKIITTATPVTGLALDWLDKNIYWSMGNETGSIHLVAQVSKSDITIIAKNLPYPRAIILHPLERFMFWISGSSSSLIERAYIDGTDRRTIVSSGRLTSPLAMAIDRLNNIVYWSDSGYVRSCKMDGSDMKTIDITTSAVLFPRYVEVYKTFVVVTEDGDSGSDIVTVRNNKVTLSNHGHVKAIRVLDPILQPEKYGPCHVLNGGCEQICLPVGRNRLCQCSYGFKLDDNRQTCSSEPLKDNFLYVTDWTHDKVYQVSLLNTSDVRALDTNHVTSPNGVAYNPRTNKVVLGDTTGRSIHMMNTDGSDYTLLSNIGVHLAHPDRFAIDIASGNIYYTAVSLTSGPSWVGVVSTSGLHRKLIEYDGRPRDIVVEPSKGLLFWTDHNDDSPFVKKANMDGTSVTPIINSNIAWPNGLAIDYRAERLYLTDGKLNTIQKCTYMGQCTLIYGDPAAQLMDIDLLGDDLYITAWNRHYLTKLDKTDEVSVYRVAANAEFGRLDSVTLYSSSADPQPVSAACSANQGRGVCSTFCLPTSHQQGYTCACEDGVDLKPDMKTCENVIPPTTTTTSTTTTTTTMTSTETTESTTASSGIQLPLIIGVASGGGALLIIIIIGVIILALVMLRRKRSRSKSGGRVEIRNPVYADPEQQADQSANTQSAEERQSTVYDLIKLNDEDTETGPEKEHTYTEPRYSNTYMSLNFAGTRNLQAPTQSPPFSISSDSFGTDTQQVHGATTAQLSDYLEPI